MGANVISTKIAPQMNISETREALDDAQYEYNKAMNTGQYDVANSYLNEIIEYKIILGMSSYRVGF